MRKKSGFTLIELIIFVVVLSIAAATILAVTVFALKYAPISHRQTITTATATGCMEYLLGQRSIKGFNFNSQTCPGGGDDTAVPSFCNTITPTDVTTTVTISCTTVPSFSGTQVFKQIKVDSNDAQTAAGTSLKLLISNY